MCSAQLGAIHIIPALRELEQENFQSEGNMGRTKALTQNQQMEYNTANPHCLEWTVCRLTSPTPGTVAAEDHWRNIKSTTESHGLWDKAG